MPGRDGHRDQVVVHAGSLIRPLAENAARPQRQHQQDRQEPDDAAVVRATAPAGTTPRRCRPSARPPPRPGTLPSPPTTAAAKIDSMARNPVSGSIVVSSPISMPPSPASPMPANETMRPHRVGVDPLDVGQHRVVGHRAHRLAGAGERQEAEHAPPSPRRRPQDSPPAAGRRAARRSASPAASAGRSRAARCRSTKRTTFSSSDRQRDRADRRRDEPGRPERLQHELVAEQAHDPRREEGAAQAPGRSGRPNQAFAT